MNNKKLGTDFEVDMCELMARSGFWVHFIEPNRAGAQPFDIVAARGGRAYAIDAKTCAAGSFNISRLEDNQRMAFDLWLSCGNYMPFVAVKHDDVIYMIDYATLQEKRSVKLNQEVLTYEEWLSREPGGVF